MSLERTLALLLAATLGAPTLAAEESAVEKMVVFPVAVASGIDSKKGKLLDEVILVELASAKPEGVELVGSDDVTTVLGHEQQRQLLDCDDTSCLAEIGNALGASHILSLSLGTMGSQFLITSKVINARNAAVAHRKVVYTDATEDALLAGVRETGNHIASSLGWKAQGASPVVAEAEDEEGEGLDPLFLAGVGLAGAGGLAFAGLGIGAIAVDATVVGDTGKDLPEREGGATTVLILGGSSLVGAAALAAGAALLAVSLM